MFGGLIGGNNVRFQRPGGAPQNMPTQPRISYFKEYFFAYLG